jgi:hypothetical protein
MQIEPRIDAGLAHKSMTSIGGLFLFIYLFLKSR